MRHAVISTDGAIRFDDAARPEAAVGPEGSNRVALPRTGLAGRVNDVGLLFPERYPVNVIGSALLISLRAAEQPYAGPVVITGEHLCPWRGAEMCALTDMQIDLLTIVHRDIRLATEGRSPVTPGLPAGWDQAIRALAERLRTLPSPTLRVRDPWTGRDL